MDNLKIIIMTDIYKDFTEILTHNLLDPKKRNSVKEEIKNSIKSYCFFPDRNGTSKKLEASNVDYIMSLYYDSFITKENNIFVEATLPSDNQYILFDFLKIATRNNVITNPLDNKLSNDFLNIFDQFFTKNIPNTYPELIAGVKFFYRKTKNVEVSQLVLEKIVSSLVNQDKIWGFSQDGEKNLIHSLKSMQELSFNKNNYPMLKFFLGYHNPVDMTNDNAVLIKVKQFIKEKVVMDSWLEFEPFTHRKESTILSSQGEVLNCPEEITYSIVVNLDNLKQNYLPLSLGSDAATSIHQLTNILNKNVEKLDCSEIFSNMNLQISPKIKLLFTTSSDKNFDKQFMTDFIYNFLDSYSGLINDSGKIKDNELQDIFNYSMIETKTKKITKTQNKKKI